MTVNVVLENAPPDWAAERFDPDHWKSKGIRLRVVDGSKSHNPADPEALIIGPHVRGRRRLAAAWRGHNPWLKLIFIVEEASRLAFEGTLPFSPQLSDAVVLGSEASPAQLHLAVKALVESGRRERQEATLYGRLNQMLRHDGTSRAAPQRQGRLEVAERYLATILTQLPCAIFSAHPDGRLIDFNEAAEQLLRPMVAEETTRVWDLFVEPAPGKIRLLLEQAVAGRRLVKSEATVHGSAGQRRVELSIAPVLDPGGKVEALSFSAFDVTARVEAEEALRQLASRQEELVGERTQDLRKANEALQAEIQQREVAEGQIRQMQKMEAVGQLTGGIAHDFNNMIAVVISGLNLVQRRLERGETDVDKYLEASLEGAQRAARLTQRLLAFARQQPLSPQATDANQLVSGMSELLHRTLGETVRLETVLAAGLWTIWADPVQLENALINLAINSRDAMPGGGRLTIETANTHFDDGYALEHAMAAGQYVMIAVTDNGSGIPADVVDKVFDPFFTTKGAGKGTGLGLSQVYGFVKQSKGHVKVYSEPGHGTTVKIYLPRHFGEAATLQRESLGAIPRGSLEETILVVEDEDRVRELTVLSLRELGYRVLEARNGRTALDVLEAHPEVQLLFTDVVMPEMNGRQLADIARERMPQIKVLFTTGYTRNAIVHNGIVDPDVALLQKPATTQQMAVKVRFLLDQV